MHPKKQILVLPFPPSENHYWRHPHKGKLAGRHLISERGRAYRIAVMQIVALSKACEVFDGSLRVVIEVRAPDRRRRDIQNLDKALLDALTHAGVWYDDSQIDDFRIWRIPISQMEKTSNAFGEVIVTIEQINYSLELFPHVANA